MANLTLMGGGGGGGGGGGTKALCITCPTFNLSVLHIIFLEHKIKEIRCFNEFITHVISPKAYVISPKAYVCRVF